MWPFKRRDWYETGHTRRHVIKETATHAVERYQKEMIDMNSGEKKWVDWNNHYNSDRLVTK